MLAVLGRSVAVASVLAVSASVAQAQVRIEEIRVDVAGVHAANGNLLFNASIPGSVALGIYLSDKVALEPSVGVRYFSPDAGSSSTLLTLGVFAPYYFAGSRGRAGVFVAPGVEIIKASGTEAAINFGADVGYKAAVNPKVSMSVAGTVRAGDTYDPETLIGARFGFSVFWR